MLVSGLYLYLLYFAASPAWRYIRLAQATHGASGWIPVTALLKDARCIVLKDQLPGWRGRLQRMSRGKRMGFFWAVYEMNGRHFGCLTPTLYPFATRHELTLISGLEGKVGTSVTLYVDKDRPHKACLLAPQKHRSSWLLMRMCFSVMVALTIFFWQLRLGSV